MANTPTTPSSIAARLTDKDIYSFARFIDGCADDNVCTDEEAKIFSKKAITEFNQFELRYRNIAAVLRDYVRLRSHKLQMIKPHLCAECANWSDSGCEVGGCADFNTKGEAK